VQHGHAEVVERRRLLPSGPVILCNRYKMPSNDELPANGPGGAKKKLRPSEAGDDLLTAVADQERHNTAICNPGCLHVIVANLIVKEPDISIGWIVIYRRYIDSHTCSPVCDAGCPSYARSAY